MKRTIVAIRRHAGQVVALALACLMLVSVEAGVRRINPRSLMRYEESVDAYRIVRQTLDTEGAPDICFVGSSRCRDGVVMPVVAKACWPATVGNFSLPGATALVVRLSVRRIVNADPKPRLILYGVTPRQLRAYIPEQIGGGVEGLVGPGDLPMLAMTPDASAHDMFEATLRNGISSRVRAISFRDGLKARVFRPETKQRPYHMHGALSAAQVPKKQPRLCDNPYTPERARTYVYPDGGEDNRVYVDSQLTHIEGIMDLCADAGVPLVLFEIPSSATLERALPEGMLVQATEKIAAVAEKKGVRFVRLSDMGLAFTEADFRDISHLNNTGARRLTDALLESVILPLTSRAILVE